MDAGVTQVRIFPNLPQLSRAAAERVVQLAQRSVQARGRFSIALAGGTTPRPLYTLLAGQPYREQVPWPSVHCWWTDERCVSPDHPASNFRMAEEALLSHVPVPPANLHRIPVDQGTPAQTAAQYEQTLRASFQLAEGGWPAFDLIILGLGEDGHMASLFPHAPALQETRHLVTTTSGGQPPLPRITLTLPVLQHARQLLWLVAGRPKASVVRAVLEGGDGPPAALPARLAQPGTGEALWLLDQAAAGLLTSRP